MFSNTKRKKRSLLQISFGIFEFLSIKAVFSKKKKKREKRSLLQISLGFHDLRLKKLVILEKKKQEKVCLHLHIESVLNFW